MCTAIIQGGHLRTRTQLEPRLSHWLWEALGSAGLSRPTHPSPGPYSSFMGSSLAPFGQEAIPCCQGYGAL